VTSVLLILMTVVVLCWKCPIVSIVTWCPIFSSQLFLLFPSFLFSSDDDDVIQEPYGMSIRANQLYYQRGGEGVQIKGFPSSLTLNVPGFKPSLFSILDGVSLSFNQWFK